MRWYKKGSCHHCGGIVRRRFLHLADCGCLRCTHCEECNNKLLQGYREIMRLEDKG